MDSKAVMKYIEKRSEPCPATGCWLWTGQTDKHGYGQYRLFAKDKWHKAHRESLKAFKQVNLDGLGALHTCDNKTCVNPDHLYAGSQKDNVRDMINRGRNKNGSVKKQFCQKGHELTDENRLNHAINNGCKICHKNRQAKYREIKNASIQRTAT
jgi:hypothetical protein